MRIRCGIQKSEYDLKTSAMRAYWTECVSQAMDDCGLLATPEQIESIAEAVEIGHENYGVAHGYDCIPNPDKLEIVKLEKALREEQEKIVCPDCNGKGIEVSYGGTRMSVSACFWCRGEGKRKP